MEASAVVSAVAVDSAAAFAGSAAGSDVVAPVLEPHPVSRDSIITADSNILTTLRFIINPPSLFNIIV